jgi:hypothetical protein
MDFVCTIPVFNTPYGCCGCNKKICDCPDTIVVHPVEVTRESNVFTTQIEEFYASLIPVQGELPVSFPITKMVFNDANKKMISAHDYINYAEQGATCLVETMYPSAPTEFEGEEYDIDDFYTKAGIDILKQDFEHGTGVYATPTIYDPVVLPSTQDAEVPSIKNGKIRDPKKGKGIIFAKTEEKKPGFFSRALTGFTNILKENREKLDKVDFVKSEKHKLEPMKIEERIDEPEKPLTCVTGAGTVKLTPMDLDVNDNFSSTSSEEGSNRSLEEIVLDEKNDIDTEERQEKAPKPEIIEIPLTRKVITKVKECKESITNLFVKKDGDDDKPGFFTGFVLAGVKVYLEDIKTSFVSMYDTYAPLGRGLGLEVHAMLCEILEWVRKHPKQVGACAAFVFMMLRAKEIYTHAHRFYSQDTTKVCEITTVFPEHDMLGMVGSNATFFLLTAFGFQGIWERSMKEEVKDSCLLEALTNVVGGATTFFGVIACFMSALNLAAYSTAKYDKSNANKKGVMFTNSNQDRLKFITPTPNNKVNTVIRNPKALTTLMNLEPHCGPSDPDHEFCGLAEMKEKEEVKPNVENHCGPSDPKHEKCGIKTPEEKYEEVKEKIMNGTYEPAKKPVKELVVKKPTGEVWKRPTKTIKVKKDELSRTCSKCKINQCTKNAKGKFYRQCTVCHQEKKKTSAPEEKFVLTPKDQKKNEKKKNIENHAKKSRRNKKKVNFNYDLLDENEAYHVIEQQENKLRALNRYPTDDAWEDLDDEPNFLKDIRFDSKALEKLGTKICETAQIEKHSKIPVPSISRNIVKLGDHEFDYAYGYVIAPNIVMAPSHFVNITHVHRKESNSIGVVKIPCEQVFEYTESGFIEGVKLFKVDKALPHNNIRLSIPQSEFPGVIIAPSFSQVSSIKYLIDKGLLSYIADSQLGDCGQPVIDAEANSIVGLHIGVSTTMKVARVAYAVAFTPKLLSAVQQKVKELGF